MDLESRHKDGIYSLKVLEFREGNQAVVKHPIVKMRVFCCLSSGYTLM